MTKKTKQKLTLVGISILALLLFAGGCRGTISSWYRQWYWSHHSPSGEVTGIILDDTPDGSSEQVVSEADGTENRMLLTVTKNSTGDSCREITVEGDSVQLVETQIQTFRGNPDMDGGWSYDEAYIVEPIREGVSVVRAEAVGGYTIFAYQFTVHEDLTYEVADLMMLKQE